MSYDQFPEMGAVPRRKSRPACLAFSCLRHDNRSERSMLSSPLGNVCGVSIKNNVQSIPVTLRKRLTVHVWCLLHEFIWTFWSKLRDLWMDFLPVLLSSHWFHFLSVRGYLLSVHHISMLKMDLEPGKRIPQLSTMSGIREETAKVLIQSFYNGLRLVTVQRWMATDCSDFLESSRTSSTIFSQNMCYSTISPSTKNYSGKPEMYKV